MWLLILFQELSWNWADNGALSIKNWTFNKKMAHNQEFWRVNHSNTGITVWPCKLVRTIMGFVDWIAWKPIGWAVLETASHPATRRGLDATQWSFMEKFKSQVGLAVALSTPWLPGAWEHLTWHKYYVEMGQWVKTYCHSVKSRQWEMSLQVEVQLAGKII